MTDCIDNVAFSNARESTFIRLAGWSALLNILAQQVGIIYKVNLHQLLEVSYHLLTSKPTTEVRSSLIEGSRGQEGRK